MFIIHGNAYFCKNAGPELRCPAKIYTLHKFGMDSSEQLIGNDVRNLSCIIRMKMKKAAPVGAAAAGEKHSFSNSLSIETEL